MNFLAVLCKIFASILRSSVAVEDSVSLDVPVPSGHFQCVNDQTGPHVIRDMPTNDHACCQVDHNRNYVESVCQTLPGVALRDPDDGQQRDGRWDSDLVRSGTCGGGDVHESRQ